MINFKLWVSAGGRNDIQGEIDRLSEYGLGQFTACVLWAANTPKPQWSRPRVAKLQGYKDLYEIRFNSGNLEVRPLGCFGPGSDEFTILVWSAKKGSNYKPHSAIDTAAARAKALGRGQGIIVSLQIDGEDFPPSDE